MGLITYLVLDMPEAKDGIGIAKKSYYDEHEWQCEILHKGTFEECLMEKKRLLK